MESSKKAIIGWSLFVGTLIGALVAYLTYKYLTKDNKNPTNMRKWSITIAAGLAAMVISGLLIFYIAKSMKKPETPAAAV